MQRRWPNAVQARHKAPVMAALALLTLVTLPTPVRADDTRPSWREVWKWRETWSGVDIARDNWLIYSGTTVAPFGHIHEPGWRMPLAGGYGQYKYDGNRGTGPTPDIQSFAAATYYGDALVGYLERWGPLTAKALPASPISPTKSRRSIPTISSPATTSASKASSNSGSTSATSASPRSMPPGTLPTTRATPAPASAPASPPTGAAASKAGSTSTNKAIAIWAGTTAPPAMAMRKPISSTTPAPASSSATTGTAANSLSGGVSGGSFASSGTASPEPYATLNWMTQF